MKKSAVIHKNTLEIRNELDRLGYKFIPRESENKNLMGGYFDGPEQYPNAYIVTDANYKTYHIALTKEHLPVIENSYIECDNEEMFFILVKMVLDKIFWICRVDNLTIGEYKFNVDDIVEQTDENDWIFFGANRSFELLTLFDLVKKFSNKDEFDFLDLTIGQLNLAYDDAKIISVSDLLNIYEYTVYKLADFFDCRKSTCLSRFKYDPYTGKKIEWNRLNKIFKKYSD